MRAHKRDNNLLFWISGFIRSFERVLRVQSRINIRFFLFSSLVSGASVLRSLVFHSQKKRTYVQVSGVSTKYNKRDNRAYKTGNAGEVRSHDAVFCRVVLFSFSLRESTRCHRWNQSGSQKNLPSFR